MNASAYDSPAALASVLAVLADGMPHSPAQLAAASGLEVRGATQAVLELEQAGLPVVHRADGSVNLRRAFGALDAGRIGEHLARLNVTARVRVTALIDSTNSALLRDAREDRLGTQPRILVTELQTAGRGRQGRQWFSSPGASLAASFGFRMARGIAGLSGLSLACGLGVREALARHGLEARLKWPNDVLVGDAKLAGILVEVHPLGAQETAVIVGVGMNVAADMQRSARLAEAGVLKVTDMESAGGGAAVDRNGLVADLADALTRRMERFAREGFVPFVDDWNSAHAWHDRPVQMVEQGHVISSGLARGVDEQGRLQLETPAGLLRVVVGDVSLRPL